MALRSSIFDPIAKEAVYQKTHVLGCDDDGGDYDDGGRISRPGQTPSHHAGITYPVRVQNLTPIIFIGAGQPPGPDHYNL